MAEYALSYTGEKVNKLLGLVDNDNFASNDVVIASNTQPTSETCKVWVETDSDAIKDIHFRV